jgi:hypothetical protein
MLGAFTLLTLLGGLLLVNSNIPEPLPDQPALPKVETPPVPPSVVLLPVPGQLQLHNRGTSEILLWGTKVEGALATIEKEPRIIPTGHFYYFLEDDLRKFLDLTVGNEGDRLLDFDIYISTADKRDFIARFKLFVKIRNGEIEIHTQQLGVAEGKWN